MNFFVSNSEEVSQLQKSISPYEKDETAETDFTIEKDGIRIQHQREEIYEKRKNK